MARWQADLRLKAPEGRLLSRDELYAAQLREGWHTVGVEAGMDLIVHSSRPGRLGRDVTDEISG